MEEVFAGYSAIRDICGKQKSKDGTYRRSALVLTLPCEEGTLLYHTLTGELLLRGADEPDSDIRQTLMERWFLVPEDFDERKHADEVRAVMELLQKPKTAITSYTILPTTECNARCFYCYEHGHKKTSMKEQTARDIADYISCHHKGEKVSFDWFGGEPLLNVKAIDLICETLQEKGVEFSSRIVSNGYLLNEELVKKACALWKLNHAQITLDGTRETYIRTKAYVSASEDPFERVLGNIALLLKAGVHVSIRLNMNEANYADLMELADQLGQRFAGEPELNVYAALLRDYEGDNLPFSDHDEAYQCFCSLESRLNELGFHVRPSLSRQYWSNFCMADNDGSVLILPDGTLAKCEHDLEKKSLGSIYSEELDRDTLAFYKTHRRGSSCGDCAVYGCCQVLKECHDDHGVCTNEKKKIERDKLIEMIRNSYQSWQEHKADPQQSEDESEEKKHEAC